MIQRPQEPTAARLLKWPPPESQLSLETGKEDLKRWMKHLQWHNQISMIFWLFLKNSGTSITDVVWHTIYCTRCIWHRSKQPPYPYYHRSSVLRTTHISLGSSLEFCKKVVGAGASSKEKVNLGRHWYLKWLLHPQCLVGTYLWLVR